MRVNDVIGLSLREYWALEKKILPLFKAGKTIEEALNDVIALFPNLQISEREKAILAAGFICGVLETRNDIQKRLMGSL